MKTEIKSPYGQENVTVENDAEDITLWQNKDVIMLFDAKMARKFIKAIRKSAKELGWSV